MSLIQFTRNHTDHSTDKGYQFEFFCDRCHNGFMSGFAPSAMGLASSAARTLGSMFGGVTGQRGRIGLRDRTRGPGAGHDKAFRAAIEEAKPNFRQCPKCTHWVCQATCWNAKRMLCFNCAPDVETELASRRCRRKWSR
jgi:hypothetical protein